MFVKLTVEFVIAVGRYAIMTIPSHYPIISSLLCSRPCCHSSQVGAVKACRSCMQRSDACCTGMRTGPRNVAGASLFCFGFFFF